MRIENQKITAYIPKDLLLHAQSITGNYRYLELWVEKSIARANLSKACEVVWNI